MDPVTWHFIQEFLLAVLGRPIQTLAVVYLAGVIALIIFVLALGLLRRMVNP